MLFLKETERNQQSLPVKYCSSGDCFDRMEKGFGSWFQDQHTDWQPLNSISLSGAPFGLGQQYTAPPYVNACNNMLSPDERLPMFALNAEQPHMKASQPIGTRGWFYCLPRFRQGFSPVLNSVPKEKLPTCLEESCKGDGASNGVQKRFVVFDQSGDQTTLIFSPGIGAPVRYLPSWNAKPHYGFDLKKEEQRTKHDADHPTRPFSLEEYNNELNEKDDVRSEMHEDTEELNALLYSDDEFDYSEDEEEISTGHSPSTMTGNDRQEWLEKDGEEVASSCGTAKRQKLANGDYDIPSLVDTASSVKIDQKSFGYEDDAELSCCGGNVGSQGFEELGSPSGKKRSRKEKVRETISILQDLIPGGKNCQDAIVVIDEAIHYLKSLKVKARALGLDSL